MQKELSIVIQSEKNAKALALTTTSAATTAPLSTTNDVPVTLLCDADFALCQGESPTAVFPTTSVAGNDVIPANTKVRGIVRAGNKLAAITGTGTGTLYITVDG